ncbi:MAG TPA: hypothetical protein VMS88_03040 [Terriglobales bacterium]|nr:hypothetical protein [Terriglobales bacterium]
MLALVAVRDSFDVTTPTQTAVTWLKAQCKSDGGFGTGPAGNPYETSLALLAMAPVDSMAAEFARGLTYLIMTQRLDGNWNGDVSTTVLAGLVLHGHLFKRDDHPTPGPPLSFTLPTS